MTQLQLTGEQARLVAASSDPVEVYDELGTRIGILQPTKESEIDLAVAKWRLASKDWYTTEEVVNLFNDSGQP
ncbi:MAG: hypothetical protein O3A00_10600 [Planctomycetota bacterium]|nr:hypothetical protein [Planctomycetota bacterium]